MANPAQENQQGEQRFAASTDATNKKDPQGQSSYSTIRPNNEKKLSTSDDRDEDETDEEDDDNI